MRPLLLRLTKARPLELSAVLASFCLFFSLLAAYYVLRPLRDEMAMQLGGGGVQRLFDAVFVTMLAAVPTFGWLVRRFPRRDILPWIYGFFVLHLLVFAAVMVGTGPQHLLVAQSFFVWVTVFSATGVSVFWSLMADLFSTDQAKRCYGFIAAGGTAGALLGPALTVGLVHLLGPRYLVLVAAALLCGTVLATRWLRGAAANLPRAEAQERGETKGAGHPGSDPTETATATPPSEGAVSGSVWSGVSDVLRSPLLLGICAFLLLFTTLSTLLYFQTAELLPRFVTVSADRTSLLAKVDGAISLLALALQLFVFPRAVARGGVSAMLVALPCLSVFGFLAVATWPTLLPLLLFGVIRRAGEYAISKPARETLFTALTPDEKYKAKNVIDTLVYRGGDELSSRAFTGLRSLLGVTTHQLICFAIPLSLLWTWIAWRLGRTAHSFTQSRAGSPPRTASGT